jgi:tripartite-type tricarboxylate transporter receptor subunit TctC
MRWEDAQMARVRLLAVSVVFLCLAAVGAAPAQENYPSHSIRWIVGYPPGGSTDIVARLTAQWLSEHLGQQVIVDNRPGAGNNIATEAVARAAPDGYTLLLVNPANFINTTLYEHLNFDYLKDIAAVGGIAEMPNVMEVNPNVPAKTVSEFIALAKASPGKINMASSGNGTSVHMSGELFMMMANVNLTHVPYRGAAPALTDMLAGQVQVMFDNMPSSIGHIKAGKLRALAVTTAKRWDSMPDLPTVGETVPGYEATAIFGMGVPAGTPPEIIAHLNKEINAALADPGFKARLADLGAAPLVTTPKEFGAISAEETEKWAKVVKFSGAKVE